MPDRGHPAGPRISHILAGLVQETTGERVRLRDLTEALGGRAFELLILVFALPNAVGFSAIPGVSTVFGVPQIFVAAQMVLRPSRLWLPAWLLDRSIPRRDFVAMINRIMPRLVRLEGVLRERWMIVPLPVAERLAGIVLTILALIQALPIPLGNQPPAIAAVLMTIGLLARDGLVMAIGLVAALVSIAIAAAIAFGGLEAVRLLSRHLFG